MGALVGLVGGERGEQQAHRAAVDDETAQVGLRAAHGEEEAPRVALQLRVLTVRAQRAEEHGHRARVAGGDRRAVVGAELTHQRRAAAELERQRARLQGL